MGGEATARPRTFPRGSIPTRRSDLGSQSRPCARRSVRVGSGALLACYGNGSHFPVATLVGTDAADDTQAGHKIELLSKQPAELIVTHEAWSQRSGSKESSFVFT